VAKRDHRPKGDAKPKKDQGKLKGAGGPHVYKKASGGPIPGSALSQNDRAKPKDDDWDPRKPERRKK
jgi:hypothetical protein